MRNVRDMLARMAEAEAAFEGTRFVAPCPQGGRVRTRVAGIVRTFRTAPADFEGWGVFRPDGETARLVEEADLPLIDAYLSLFPRLRLRLARPLGGTIWLAYPANEADMNQRFGPPRPVAVHLVTEGGRFEPIVAHAVGGTWFFAASDRRADTAPTEALREAFRQTVEPDVPMFAGRTPEMRTVYELAAQADPRFRQRRRERQASARREAEREGRRQREQARRAFEADVREQDDPGWYGPRIHRGQPRDTGDERRLRQALRTGGGELRDFNDRGEYYLVEWTTGDGRVHTSAISRGDLTVVSSGICLSGRDRDFDLQSLVGVMERR
ncbi:MAG: hypothetical protein SFU56_06345 [Capsulimonadales bacterium]|nr:hypothetical protein [Capsulimonadales bacterium]